MRVLILGGDGMLGHHLLMHLRERHEVRVTLRRPLADYTHYALFDASNSYDDIEVREFERIVKVHADFRPHAIINAVGIVKQRALAEESIPSLKSTPCCRIAWRCCAGNAAAGSYTSVPTASFQVRPEITARMIFPMRGISTAAAN